MATVALTGFVAVSAGWGGCKRFEDTYVDFTTVSASSTGSGGGGDGGMGPVTAEEFFEVNIRPGLVSNCAGSDCHSSGGKAFISTGTEYAAITTYETALGIPLLVDPPELSPLLTHPDSGEHTGPTWSGLEGLRSGILQWLQLEAENLEPIKILQVGPVTPNGFTIIPLDGVGPEFVGSRLSFYATSFGDPATVLELADIAIWPPNGLGIRATNPTVFVVPPAGPAEADISFHGDPHVFVAPGQVKLGAGELLLPNWVAGSQLVFTFEELQILFSDVDGSVYDPCTEGELFQTAVEALPLMSGDNSPNGLMYCAEQCHGGNQGIAPTNKFNIFDLLSDAPNYPFMCAKVKPFIVSTNVDESAIVTFTDPQGGSGHQFIFGGNPGAHGTFKSTMSEWINKEGVEEER